MAAYLLITNPISSRALSDREVAEVAGVFASKGARLDVHKTASAGDACAAAAGHAYRYDGIIAAGGDGTIGEIINGLAGCPLPVGILPRGTANVLARELGIPKSPPQAVDVILRGRTATLDVGMAGDRRFLLMASAGYDAQVVALAHGSRGTRFGYASYLRPMARALVACDLPEIQVVADGKSYCCRHAIVANVAGYGGPFRPARGAVHDDGLLDVVMQERPGRLGVARYAFAAFLGHTASLSDVVTVRATQVTLSSQARAPLQVDGDPAGFLPRAIRIVPGGATVIVP